MVTDKASHSSRIRWRRLNNTKMSFFTNGCTIHRQINTNTCTHRVEAMKIKNYRNTCCFWEMFFEKVGGEAFDQSKKKTIPNCLLYATFTLKTCVRIFDCRFYLWKFGTFMAFEIRIIAAPITIEWQLQKSCNVATHTQMRSQISTIEFYAKIQIQYAYVCGKVFNRWVFASRTFQAISFVFQVNHPRCCRLHFSHPLSLAHFILARPQMHKQTHT